MCRSMRCQAIFSRLIWPSPWLPFGADLVLLDLGIQFLSVPLGRLSERRLKDLLHPVYKDEFHLIAHLFG